jgi:hypothetical protein
MSKKLKCWNLKVQWLALLGRVRRNHHGAFHDMIITSVCPRMKMGIGRYLLILGGHFWNIPLFWGKVLRINNNITEHVTSIILFWLIGIWQDEKINPERAWVMEISIGILQISGFKY